MIIAEQKGIGMVNVLIAFLRKDLLLRPTIPTKENEEVQDEKRR